MSSFRRARTTYCTAEKTWTVYNDEEKPAYSRWLRSTFGPELSEIQDLIRRVDYQAYLLRLLQWEAMESGDDPRTCYERVIDRMENPEKYEPENPFEPDSDEPFGAEDDFREFDDGFDDDFDDGFEEVMDELFEGMFGHKPPKEPKRSRKKGPGQDEGFDLRLKSAYRDLVRRLHPDMNADLSAEKREIWHQVQAAYQARDLNALEVLLTHQEIDSGRISGQTPVSHILALARHFVEARRSLRIMIRNARREAAWGFLGWSDKIKKKNERLAREEITYDLRALRGEREMLDRRIEEWKNAAPAPNPLSAARPGTRLPKPDPAQAVFDFSF